MKKFGAESSGSRSVRSGADALFTEAAAWKGISSAWQPLHGSFSKFGFSIEWHDFVIERDFEWSPSFHPASIEICLNLAGHAQIQSGNSTLKLSPLTAGFYAQNQPRLTAIRQGGERHQFLTIEISPAFARRHIQKSDEGLHPALTRFLSQSSPYSAVSSAREVTADYQAIVKSLRLPSIPPGGRRLWSQAKTLEIASNLFYEPAQPQEQFCERLKRVNRDRTQKVIAILKENLAEPPPLEEIGRRVGCSHFYLSRIFTQEMGRSMTNYLRTLRMERAAEHLREGKLKITHIALEVGYSSPSHFSTAFHETFGCCPGLYPLRTQTQALRVPPATRESTE